MDEFVKIQWVEDGVIEVFEYSEQEAPSREDIKKGENEWVEVIDENDHFVTVQFDNGDVATINRACFKVVEE